MPTKDAFSRFLNLLMKHQASILEIFHRLVDELKKYLPDLGEKSAADSKAIQSFGKPVKDEQKLAEDDGRRDTDADCPSRHSLRSFLRMLRIEDFLFTCHPEEAEGRLEGHLLVDSIHELPISFSPEVASSSDMTHLMPLVEDVETHHSNIHSDMAENTADKGYDSAENNAGLFDHHGIKPVIDTRTLWKTKTHEILFPERFDVFSYDEAGQVFCSCPSEKRGAKPCRSRRLYGTSAPIRTAGFAHLQASLAVTLFRRDQTSAQNTLQREILYLRYR